MMKLKGGHLVNDLPMNFSSKRKAVIVAPAGCGKTELIVQSIIHSNGKQIILTHTHAGIKSLKDRFKKYSIKTNKYTIDTISGFGLRYASSYPGYCGLETSDYVDEPKWSKIYVAAEKLFRSEFGKMILKESYSGIYVDEYQDCTCLQHNMIEAMSEMLPCRIVGDPLQGIFDFNNEEIVNWGRDVFTKYEKLEGLNYPWRWHNNPSMRDWIQNIREKLVNGEEIDLTELPSTVHFERVSNIGTHIKACYHYYNRVYGKIVAIHKWPAAAHSLAQKLNGLFVSMEEVEAKDLMILLNKLSKLKSFERVLLLIEFAGKCMTKINTHLSPFILKLNKQNLDFKRIKNNREIGEAILYLVSDDELNNDFISKVINFFSGVQKLNGVKLYRKELLNDFIRTLNNYLSDSSKDLKSIGRSIRNKSRITGRVVSNRIVSRTLLIKGLEFDHAILFNADDPNIDAKELYVGLTRAVESLTIFSSNSKILKTKPNI